MTNGSDSKLSSLIFRSAFAGQLSALVFLAILSGVGILLSLFQEKKGACERAQITWEAEKDRLLQPIIQGMKGAELKLSDLADQGGWSAVAIHINSPMKSIVRAGNSTRWNLTCAGEFNYAGFLQGRYEFFHPVQILGGKLFALLAALGSAIAGIILIAFFQRRVIQKDVLDPLSDIRRNLKRLAIGEEIAFATSSSCLELKELQTSIQMSFRERQLLQAEMEQKKLVEELTKFFSKTAHRLRNPLTLFNYEFGQAQSFIPEEHRVIMSSAVSQFNQLADQLSDRSRQLAEVLIKGKDAEVPVVKDERCPQLLLPLITSIVGARKSQLAELPGIRLVTNLNASLYGVFVEVDPNEFHASLTHMINNSIEAIENEGIIEINVRVLETSVEISVVDSGKGISPDILPKLGEWGHSYGKEGKGTGVGLFDTKNNIESCGGSLSIQSELGKGTTVSLLLPRASSPSWYVPEFSLYCGDLLVIVDDDGSIHELWEKRLAGKGVEIIHRSNPSALKHWKENHEITKPVTYLVDYEYLGHSQTGLEIVRELGIQHRSILVTHYAERSDIQKLALQERIHLLPKTAAIHIPIRIEKKSC